MSTDLANRTSDDICREINACSTKLAQAEKKARTGAIPGGSTCQELKDRFPDIWLKEVKEKCHIGRAMAYRILQLPPPGKEKSSKNNDCESTSRQAEYSSEERAEQQEERPRDIAIRLSCKAPEIPEELAADAMLLVEILSGTISDRSPAHSSRTHPHVDRGPEGQRHRGRCSGGRVAFGEEARASAGLEEQAQGGGAGA